MIWFTSDLHLGHEAVIEFCGRPYANVAEMDAHLVKQWNNSVKPGDLIYVLGDLCFHRPVVGIPLLNSLQGEKVLIRGNHDGYSMSQYRQAGFTVLEEAVIKFHGKRVTLSHFPYWPKENDEPDDERYPEKRPVDRGGWLFCGHIHRGWQTRERQINVGFDAWGYLPVSEGKLDSIIQGTKDVPL